MDDAAFAAAHRAEEEGLACFLDASACSLRGEAEFFDAKQAVIVGIKDDERMVLMGQPQHFHGEVFEGQEEFGFVHQQEVGLRTAELHHDIRVLDFGIGRSAFHKFVIDVYVDGVEQDVQKIADFVFVLFDWVFTRHVFRTDRVLASVISSSLH